LLGASFGQPGTSRPSSKPCLGAHSETWAGCIVCLKEGLEAIREFRVADIFFPAGSQVLRFHARQVLRPLGSDSRSYEVEFFAPLAGFVLAPSREHLTSAAWRRTIGPQPQVRPADRAEQIREVPNGFLSHALQLHA
jgi:hypothetical protein